jgi:hypothetical protein
MCWMDGFVLQWCFRGDSWKPILLGRDAVSVLGKMAVLVLCASGWLLELSLQNFAA